VKRLDKLVFGELAGPWAFGVAIFTVLIMAGSFLFELTRYLSEGVDPITTLQLVALLLPGIMAKTFPMAMLLAALLAFGRLSGDSEITALKAAGVSVGRMMLPVFFFSFGVFLLAFFFTEEIVPSASLRATELRTDIDTELRDRSEQPIFYDVYEDGILRALITAKDFSLASRTLSDAHIVTFNTEGERESVFFVEDLEYVGEEDWEARGETSGFILSEDNFISFASSDGVWPEQVAQPSMSPEDLLARTLRDLDALSMAQMAEQIRKEKANPNANQDQVANLEFGYWNKIALPLASVVFGLVGATLGIRNARTGASTGFWLSVIIIFGYLMITNALSIFARGGAVPAWVASFTPVAIGLIVAAVLIGKRNQ
jgi:lipopolysaccharide export system permease protein